MAIVLLSPVTTAMMLQLKTRWLILFLALAHWGFAQVDPSDALFTEMLRLDSLVFEEGFNKCNFAALEQVMHPDLEFQHDQSGIQNLEQFYQAVRQNICGNADVKPVRKLLPGALTVYPLYDNGALYGALQMGEHAFYIAEPGKALRHTSTAKFIHNWLLIDGQWKLKRVYSYDHR